MALMYFLDSYALIEIATDAPSYRPYAAEAAVTSKLNLLELCYAYIREGHSEQAKALFQKFASRCISISDAILLQAAEMRWKLRKQDVSYIDCIGYLLARSLGIPFLTGDRQFRDFENVEFVK